MWLSGHTITVVLDFVQPQHARRSAPALLARHRRMWPLLRLCAHVGGVAVVAISFRITLGLIDYAIWGVLHNVFPWLAPEGSDFIKVEIAKIRRVFSYSLLSRRRRELPRHQQGQS